jgi:hypothetical protein
MIGRAAYEDPLIFALADTKIFGEMQNPSINRKEILTKYLIYVKEQERSGFIWKPFDKVVLLRPLENFFPRNSGPRLILQALVNSTQMRSNILPSLLLEKCLSLMEDDPLYAIPFVHENPPKRTQNTKTGDTFVNNKHPLN